MQLHGRLYDLGSVWERREGQMIIATPLPMAGSHVFHPQQLGALQVVLQGPFDSTGCALFTCCSSGLPAKLHHL